MKKAYSYTIVLDSEEWPRYIADQMTSNPWFARHLVSIKDNQRADHWYGDNGKSQSDTYCLSREDFASPTDQVQYEEEGE